jgi:hypothetical protein
MAAAPQIFAQQSGQEGAARFYEKGPVRIRFRPCLSTTAHRAAGAPFVRIRRRQRWLGRTFMTIAPSTGRDACHSLDRLPLRAVTLCTRSVAAR